MAYETVLLLLAISILIALLVLILLQWTNKQGIEQDGQSQQIMLRLLSELRAEFQHNDARSRTETQQRLDYIMHQIGQHQQHTARHLSQQGDQQSTLVRELSAQLERVQGTNDQILGFAHQMRSLERILQNPKQRGIWGEYFLEQLLDNTLSSENYKLQYRFPDGIIVDAAVFFRDQIIPIDAKFSFSQYEKLLSEPDPAQRQRIEKAFLRDVKKRVDETAKYILPAKGTTDFAFMFIPAEGIYHYLLNHRAISNDLLEYAFSKRVILVSPTTFYAYLQTVLQGLKALKIEDSAKQVMADLAALQDRLKRYETHFEKVGKHLRTSLQMYEQAAKEFKRLDTDIIRVTAREEAGQRAAKQGEMFYD